MTTGPAIQPHPRRWATIAVSALVLLAVGAASAWALLTVLRPAEDPLSSTDHSFVRIKEGAVSDSINLNTIAQWSQQLVGINRAAGVVTDIAVEAGAEVSPGTILYSVDLRPVVVAQGAVPMFRSIGLDTVGDDVRQLQETLHTLGHYDGSIDGKVGNGTQKAINAWQKSLGVPVTGIVDVGDLIFVPTLPSRITLDSTIVSRGASLSGGEGVVLGLSEVPTFQIPVTEAQAAMMPTGTRVEITSPAGGSWEAFAEEQLRSDEGAISIRLNGKDGSSICGSECAQLPPTGKSSLRSRIIVVEEVEGLVVPSAALIIVADGSTAVVDSKGRNVAVKVIASAKGTSVITGATEGLRVQLPASDGTAR